MEREVTRFIPMGEAMVALALADHILRWNAIGRAGEELVVAKGRSDDVQHNRYIIVMPI